ncbi:MAG: thiamine pyrophosphate-binding protein [Candidatus Saganbacteria bacterium]|nr:thiamine pyrophosphate-binding protein [Candidatus Saganbacteria bacterium]
MKLSDYVASFLAKEGIKHVFAISGGASLHLIHSLENTKGIDFICPQHEQAGAMAADGYARVTHNLGAAVATSGPGATNMITGICSAYYDSVPVMYITGQVSTFRLKGDTGVRQVGFQETDIVDVCKPITKYAVQVKDPKKIRYELEKACYLARSGRPGPVLIDIPDNRQREEINPQKLKSFLPQSQKISKVRLNQQINKCIKLLAKAKRPVLILGWGVRLAGIDKEVQKLIEVLNIPVVPTWAVADVLPFDHPLMVGTFGTHGTRYANFAVQNADIVLAIGTRLDTKATGSPLDTFARGAVKIVVDVDAAELAKFKKFGLKIDLLVHSDAKDFILSFLHRSQSVKQNKIDDWKSIVRKWKEKYPICPREYYASEQVNPYVFVKQLSKSLKEKQSIFVDTGCTLAWMMQAFDFKQDQRIFHDWNNTAMGWALPAAIGASFALPGQDIVCVTGDGSLQMNIQELATVIRHNLPIKIFLINNHGYSMIQQTQDQWLDSKYLASTVEGGLAFPDFLKVAAAYGFKTFNVDKNADLPKVINDVLQLPGPVFCNIEIGSEHRVIPQVKFGRPNEDPEPFLERKEFFENMFIKPLSVSMH